MPVADYFKECCFVAVHDSIAQTLHIKGSSWGERSQKLPPDEAKGFRAGFLEQVGAKLTSQDVHWPMTLALRMHTSVRGSGLRQRTPAAIARRSEKKRQRGYLPPAEAGRSSGSAPPAGRSSGSSSWQWGSDYSWQWWRG